MNKRIYSNILLVLATTLAWAQVPAPAPAQSKPIAVMNGTVHVGNGTVIPQGIVTFDKGKITTVADATTVRIDLTGYQVIDATGKHLYPGLILPTTNLGLVEVSSVRATRDYSETGDLNPHVRSLIAFNTDSELPPTMRFTGIQLAQITPQGGLVSGTSSVVQLDAWNWEDAAYKSDDGIHINWPSQTLGARWWMGETERRENKDYQSQVDQIMTLIADTKAYLEAKPATKNLKLEAMTGALTGEKRVYVNATRAEQIVSAIQQLKGAGILNLVLTGADDVWYVRDLIKAHNIPVLIGEVHRTPGRVDEDTDLPYKLPALLHQEGILVGLAYQAGMLANARNLPFTAGTTVRHGLTKEEALALVSLNNAKILGVDAQTGTLEVGKDANLVISDGDLLDMRTNLIRYSFIQGRETPLEALQQRLYEKFKEKYESQQGE